MNRECNQPLNQQWRVKCKDLFLFIDVTLTGFKFNAVKLISKSRLQVLLLDASQPEMGSILS